jgi:hypothetical protein
MIDAKLLGWILIWGDIRYCKRGKTNINVQPLPPVWLSLPKIAWSNPETSDIDIPTEISCGQSTSSGICRLSLETWGTPQSRAIFATPEVARWHHLVPGDK